MKLHSYEVVYCLKLSCRTHKETHSELHSFNTLVNQTFLVTVYNSNIHTTTVETMAC